MKKLIIIPAYNESDNILDTVNDILSNTTDFDYIVINDCSTDNTREICEDNNLNIINLPINLGIGGSVQTGYRYAKDNGYDIAVQFDGDGQHDVRYLDIMADKLLADKCDMVIGSRFIDKEGYQSSFMRRFGIGFFYRLIKIVTGAKITDPTSGFRMIGRNIIEIFANDYPKDYPEPESVVSILRKGMKVEEIPVIMRERQGGISSISPWNSIYYMIKVSIAILVECLGKSGKKVS